MPSRHQQPDAAIELNNEFRRALDVMEHTLRHVFVTGRAGTGKSTLLEYFRAHTAKKIAVLAPTGVAALNVRGQTIHSFFRFRPDVTYLAIRRVQPRQRALYEKLDAVVIDEISMVRSDLFDCIDRFLQLNGPRRNHPFGGMQLICIGDLYQLPPVVTGAERAMFKLRYPSPYFFDAEAFLALNPEFVELEKIYRQTDAAFIKILNAVRTRSVGDADLALLTKRVQPDFEPPPEELYVRLVPTNDLARSLNERALGRLKAKAAVFRGTLEGDFREKDLPTELTLTLKESAQVMFVHNDHARRWVNGTIGRVVEIGRTRGGSDAEILVELPDGGVVSVSPHTWELFRYVYNEREKHLDTETIGSFTQYPLRLAWALTIHKSQGKTFDRVIVDMGRGAFAHGQVYVALSRCRSLEGLVLVKPIERRHILFDWAIVKFLTAFQYARAEGALSLADKQKMIAAAIAAKKRLEITYLKTNNEKSRRVIAPTEIGKMRYEGKEFLGVRAYCFERNDERVFRIDRILEILQTQP